MLPATVRWSAGFGAESGPTFGVMQRGATTLVMIIQKQENGDRDRVLKVLGV